MHSGYPSCWMGWGKDPIQRQKYPPKRAPECPPKRQIETQMDSEKELPSNVYGKAGWHMVQPNKAVRTPKLMLFVNIIYFSTNETTSD